MLIPTTPTNKQAKNKQAIKTGVSLESLDRSQNKLGSYQTS